MLLDPITRLSILNPKGHIKEGKFIDIYIGESSRSAHEKLMKRGLKLIDRSPGKFCMGVAYPTQASVELFADHSFRRGTICIASVNGRVREINWFYHFMLP